MKKYFFSPLLRFSVCALSALSVTSAQQPPSTLYIGHATLYSSPTAEPLTDAVIIVRDGLIAGVGTGSQVEIPLGARVIDARGGVVVAGFQNSHVHFSEPQWARAATRRAAVFADQFEAMFTRFGFTTVVDTGSSLEDARALRDRVVSRDISGPRVLTAGIPLYPAGAVPYYVRESVPATVLARLHQPATPEAARQIATANLDGGGDIIKLFTGSWVTNQRAVPMRLDIARAAVETAHRRGKLVFSHASNLEGLQVAIDAGVDVIAHVIDDTTGLTPRHLQEMVARKMSLVPTLTIVGGKPDTLEEVRQFRQAGGQLLFGTDAGRKGRRNVKVLRF